jgi:hypothetical protein
VNNFEHWKNSAGDKEFKDSLSMRHAHSNTVFVCKKCPARHYCAGLARVCIRERLDCWEWFLLWAQEEHRDD